MPTKVSELGQQILKAKYYAEGETQPEHLFRRVAKVCSIPDAIDIFFPGKMQEWTGETRDLEENLEKIFGEKYVDLAQTVLYRRNLNSYKLPIKVTIDQINKAMEVWKEYEEKYYEAMKNLEFMPATPVLINAGRNGMLSSCFFLRVEDSMDCIFEAVKNVALISKRGGGVGLDISSLRPSGAPVGNTKGTSSGPISFLKVFNEVGNQIKAGGIRRAALLAAMRVDHPDIMQFINCKSKEGELSNFNLSVLISDEFMKCVEEDSMIRLWHPKVQDSTIRAREIWNAIIKNTHKTGEPGVLFDDIIQRADVFKGKFGKLGINPCSELNLLEKESCILGSINLSACVENDPTGKPIFSYGKLEQLAMLGVRFLDNVVDLNDYPLEEIEERSLLTRKIGLGTMGLHDTLLKLGMPYKATNIVEGIYESLNRSALKYSEILGIERGVPEALKEIHVMRRNSAVLTVPPTGTVSIIAGVSSGIEPNFQWEYTRKDSFGEHKIRHFILDKWSYIPDYAKTALEISPEDHVNMQATVQKYICSAISKTINLPYEATVEDVEKIYKMAYDKGCKSITVYRSGSRKEEVLNREKKEEKIENKSVLDSVSPFKEPSVAMTEADAEGKEDKKEIERFVRERPRVLLGATYRYNSPSGKLYITINESYEDCKVREVLLHVAKSGTDVTAHTEAEGRLISSLLKYNVPVDRIISQLEGQRSSTVVWDHGRAIKSIPDAIAKALKEYVDHLEGFSEYVEDPILTNEKKFDIVEEVTGEPSGEICPECGEGMLLRESGCVVCKNCGMERCQ